ncbi:hypothetical protein SAMN04487914_12354 [Arthrobacter sp. ok909]|uniref:hypothetical protein n=1 Tax=Arthrobacter sp. ok909 TaxID=1761746 RepID=UPI00087E4D90|nr:hypothetical protein [Arthrobacter sp. ok909]SDP65170.1 hypothetical protein SAMN04487914_12354 [Arthrobacter sp. ok909]
MSFLVNPGFERHSTGGVGWFANNLANSLGYNDSSISPLARTGDRVLVMRASETGASIAQDFIAHQANVNPTVRSLSAFGWFRSETDETVAGALAIWDLNVSDRAVTAPFEVGPTWTLVTCTLDTLSPPSKIEIWRARVEVYLNTIDKDLLVDSLNAF